MSAPRPFHWRFPTQAFAAILRDQTGGFTNTLAQPGQPPNTYDTGPSVLASQIRAGFAGAETIVRADQDSRPVKARPGDTAATEIAFAWVDPHFFKAMPLPALAGDLATALQQPDTVVITQRMARKYFHRDLRSATP